MAGRYVRTQISERVADLMASREGREYLESHGWVQGSPIIMTQCTELLDDVMGLASVHPGSVFVATLAPDTGDLCFVYVLLPNPALKTVRVSAPETQVWKLFDVASRSCGVTFRVKHWKHSAVAYALPEWQLSAVVTTSGGHGVIRDAQGSGSSHRP